MIKSHPFRFCLREQQSPTYYNLSRYLQERGWRRTRFNWRADFSEKNFQFDSRAADCLEFKNLLAHLVTQYCPQVMPVTYCINDQNWPSVLNQIAEKYYKKDSHVVDSVANVIWILKPAFQNNGQNIKIFQQWSQLEQHYLSSNRLGGEHVLQEYLTHPHLLKGPSEGHKYSIRMFVIVTNYAGVYLYPEGYFNVALYPYRANEFNDLRPHLTNEHLREDELNVVQISTQRYALFKPFYPQIKTIVTETIKGLQQQYPRAFVCAKQPTLGIFGFDFMVDANSRVWLLEANHGPCFPIQDEHPLQKNLYYRFWQAFIECFVISLAQGQMPSSHTTFCFLL